ncbi:TPA: hypothetical protein ACH3X2_008893 [Trebouxia sp. C0005]
MERTGYRHRCSHSRRWTHALLSETLDLRTYGILLSCLASNMTSEQRAEGVKQAMKEFVDEVDRNYLRPLQKEAFLGSAQCCDTAATQEDLQSCCDRCQAPTTAAQNFVNQVLQDFSVCTRGHSTA